MLEKWFGELELRIVLYQPSRILMGMTNQRIQRYVRPSVVVLTVLITGMVFGLRASGAAVGSVLVLTIVWQMIKGRRPSWVTQWSGAWLFVTGVVAVFTTGLGSVVGYDLINPMAAGLIVATVLILPLMLVWKVWNRFNQQSLSAA